MTNSITLPQLAQNMSIWKTDKSTRPRTSPDRTCTRLIPGGQIHLCALCGKRRSRKYQRQHPLLPGQIPEPGICSRPECTRAHGKRWEDSYPQPLVVEAHHYYHRGDGFEATAHPTYSPELPGESSLSGRAEVPGDSHHAYFRSRRAQGQLVPMREESSSPVNRRTKPTLHLY
ncbi:hypothetical protein K432DRAFT_394392 [Lepidopterella palustris CBS 459.81]|uniref:Uncharacterized protein n=1 Tax=Lepidopterella palustris CBS 459.81 TaxID=1314670 RepID=A0A8E2E7K3_9PEZI|nr:hypothetical protein K432DRAFT_394392 [Lepidopterella palustris CBS 459.81]